MLKANRYAVVTGTLGFLLAVTLLIGMFAVNVQPSLAAACNGVDIGLGGCHTLPDSPCHLVVYKVLLYDGDVMFEVAEAIETNQCPFYPCPSFCY